MQDDPVATAGRTPGVAVAQLRDAAVTAGPDARIGAMGECERVGRQLEQLAITVIAGLDREGVFSERGYRRAAAAVADLLGCDVGQAGRWVKMAAQITGRVGLDGQVLPPRLPATAAAFAAGDIGLRHVETIVDALGSAAAGRLTPQVLDGAEQTLALHAARYAPRELACFARDLVAALDHDGAAPDEREPEQLNELHLSCNPRGGGGRVKATLDAPTFDAVATVLDFGGAMSPTELRALACDARVVPIVLDGAGQPLAPSWCEVHHIRKWEHHGETEITNLVMLCRFHHGVLHKDSGWAARIRDGLPEFIPPSWIDASQTPRRKPPPLLVA